MTALGIAIAFIIVVTLAYLGGKAAGEETEYDRYCSRIDQQIDYEEAERRRLREEQEPDGEA